MSLEKAMYELAYFAKKADIVNPVRVSISFGNDRDRAHFIAEIMREAKPGSMPDGMFTDSYRMRDFTYCGIRVRII